MFLSLSVCQFLSFLEGDAILTQYIASLPGKYKFTKTSLQNQYLCTEKLTSLHKKLHDAVHYVYNALHYIQNTLRYVHNALQYIEFSDLNTILHLCIVNYSVHFWTLLL